MSQTYDAGYNTLINSKLQVTKVYQNSDTVAADVIISTDPAAGQRVNENTTITVYVSSGAEQVTVPDLTNKSEADATAALTLAKLQLGTITPANSASVAEGFVISSDPLLNTSVPAGTKVNLTVSNGLVNVPDVRNLDVNVAKQQLSAPDVGLLPTVATKTACSGTQGTIVLDQSIPSGLAPQKSAIVLYVACNP